MFNRVFLCTKDLAALQGNGHNNLVHCDLLCENLPNYQMLTKVATSLLTITMDKLLALYVVM